MVVAGIALLVVLWPLLLPLLTGGVLALLLRPVFLWFRRLFRARKGAAAGATIVTFILVFVVPASFLGYLLLQEIHTVIGEARVFVEKEFVQKEGRIGQLRAFFRDHWPIGNTDEEKAQNWKGVEQRLRDSLASMVGSAGKLLAEAATGVFWTTARFLFYLVVTLFSMFFFLMDGDAFIAFLRRVSPLQTGIDERLFRDFDRTSHAIVYGTVVTAMVQATLAIIGFLILGIPRSLLLAALTFLFSMIPFIGAASVWVPTVVVLLLAERWGGAVFLAAYGTLIISGVDNLIKPLLIGRETRLHPLLCFVSIFGGLQLFGFMGIFLGPVLAAFFLTILEIYREHYYPAAGDEEAGGEPPPAEAVEKVAARPARPG